MRTVITGSSSGIGKALTERLLNAGHEVCGLARSAQDEITSKYPQQFRAHRCDVSQWSEVRESCDAIRACWPSVDALVTCAGLQGAVGRTVSTDPEAWSATVRANLDGTFYAIRALWPALAVAPRRAKIVCFSGGGATKPRAHFSAYGVAKTGVVRLVETIAIEERDRALDINAVAPGGINTRLTDEVIGLGPDVAGPEEYAAAVRQKASGGASLHRALDLVEWLLAPASDGISGRLISAVWDPWSNLTSHREELSQTDIYTLRRIGPQDRGMNWGDE